MAGTPAGDAAGDDEPDIDPEVRRLLERMVLSDFKGLGSLAEVVEGQFADLKTADGKTIPVKVLDDGRAEVFLQFNAVMPAWHLLKLMALQTGTVLSMEDDSLVFRRAEKRASSDDKLTRRTDLNSLRALLGLRAKGPDADVMELYSAHTNQALGVNLAFEPDSRDFLKITGSSQSLKLLKAAQTAALASPMRTNLSVAMITASREALEKNVTDAPSPTSPSPASPNSNPLNAPSPEVLDELAKGRSQPQLGGVFPAAQSTMILSAMLRKPGLKFKALFDEPVIWNQENLAAGVSTGKDGSTISSGASVIVKPSAGYAYSVDIASATDAVRPDGLGEDHSATTTQVLVWNNQTVNIMGFRQPDGSEVRFLVTASSTEADSGNSGNASGTGPDGQAAAHYTPETDSGVSSTTTSTAPAAGEEQAAIPVPGKPGFVTSPYSDLPVELDVSSLKHGSRFTCPLTGRKFRIP